MCVYQGVYQCECISVCVCVSVSQGVYQCVCVSV